MRIRNRVCPYGIFTCIPRIIACIEVTTAVILTHTELIKIKIKSSLPHCLCLPWHSLPLTIATPTPRQLRHRSIPVVTGTARDVIVGRPCTGLCEVKSSLSGSSHIAVTIIRNLVLMANYSISANVFCLFAMSSQGKTQREEKREENFFSNNHTGRSFTLVNDDWIGALCLSINAHKKSRNY